MTNSAAIPRYVWLLIGGLVLAHVIAIAEPVLAGREKLPRCSDNPEYFANADEDCAPAVFR